MKKEANKKCGKSDDCQKKEKPKKQATSNRMKVVKAIKADDGNNIL